jgi:hypothetical protein
VQPDSVKWKSKWPATAHLTLQNQMDSFALKLLNDAIRTGFGYKECAQCHAASVSSDTGQSAEGVGAGSCVFVLPVFCCASMHLQIFNFQC